MGYSCHISSPGLKKRLVTVPMPRCAHSSSPKGFTFTTCYTFEYFVFVDTTAECRNIAVMLPCTHFCQETCLLWLTETAWALFNSGMFWERVLHFRFSRLQHCGHIALHSYLYLQWGNAKSLRISESASDSLKYLAGQGNPSSPLRCLCCLSRFQSMYKSLFWLP